MECLCLLVFFGALGGAVAGLTSGNLGHFYHGIMLLGQGKAFGFVPDDPEEEQESPDEDTLTGSATPLDVGALLRSRLDPAEYRCLDWVPVTDDARGPAFAHLVVSPYGVFCIHRLDYDGQVLGWGDDQGWSHMTDDSDVDDWDIPNPVLVAKENARALARRLGLGARQVVPLVVAAGRGDYEEEIAKLVLDGERLLKAIDRRNTVRLSEETIRDVLQRLGLPP